MGGIPYSVGCPLGVVGVHWWSAGVQCASAAVALAVHECGGAPVTFYGGWVASEPWVSCLKEVGSVPLANAIRRHSL